MAQSVMSPGDPSKDEVLQQVDPMPVDLPPPETKRWVPRRKAVIVDAVRCGAISLEEICRRYQLSVEEFVTWQRAIETHGVPGLRVTRSQIYRDARRRATGSRRYDAWIGTLVRDALRGSERDDLTLCLRFAPEAVQRIQDMVRKEQACCSFLTFEMEERPQELWLIIRAPEAARAAADALFAQFTASVSPLP
jgi:Protein of unknown function (DUF1153)